MLVKNKNYYFGESKEETNEVRCHNPSLGHVTKARVYKKVRAKSETQESHFMLPRVWKSVKE